MNSVIELHDSEVGAISEVEGFVVVDFTPAYIHQSAGRPGYDPGQGVVQQARLFLKRGMVQGQRPVLPSTLRDGHIYLCGERHINSIPIPLEMTGEVELRLEFNDIEEVVITARGARLELIGKAREVDEFPGT